MQKESEREELYGKEEHDERGAAHEICGCHLAFLYNLDHLFNVLGLKAKGWQLLQSVDVDAHADISGVYNLRACAFIEDIANRLIAIACLKEPDDGFSILIREVSEDSAPPDKRAIKFVFASH